MTATALVMVVAMTMAVTMAVTMAMMHHATVAVAVTHSEMLRTPRAVAIRTVPKHRIGVDRLTHGALERKVTVEPSVPPLESQSAKTFAFDTLQLPTGEWCAWLGKTRMVVVMVPVERWCNEDRSGHVRLRRRPWRNDVRHALSHLCGRVENASLTSTAVVGRTVIGRIVGRILVISEHAKTRCIGIAPHIRVHVHRTGDGVQVEGRRKSPIMPVVSMEPEISVVSTTVSEIAHDEFLS